MSLIRPASVVAWDPEPVVSLGDLTFDRSDLVLAGFVDGTWPAFERSVRAGLACEEASDAGGTPTDPGLIRDAAVAFRRARGLIAGDQLRAWLAGRGLSMDDWTAHLRRTVLRERSVEPLDVVLARHPISDDAVVAVLAAEATFDGILQRLATTVVAWAAAASSPVVRDVRPTGEPDLERAAALSDDVATSPVLRLLDAGTADLATRVGRLVGLEAAYQRFVDQVSSETTLAQCLEDHRLGWLRVRCTELRLAGDDAAREALLCLREDGLEPEEVARLAGADLRHMSVELDTAEPSLASLLVSANAGEVVGPVPANGGTVRLLVVAERVPPSLRDPELLERARGEVVRAALEPLVAAGARWHGHL